MATEHHVDDSIVHQPTLTESVEASAFPDVIVAELSTGLHLKLSCTVHSFVSVLAFAFFICAWTSAVVIYRKTQTQERK